MRSILIGICRRYGLPAVRRALDDVEAAALATLHGNRPNHRRR
jgi:hypothetical protein